MRGAFVPHLVPLRARDRRRCVAKHEHRRLTRRFSLVYDDVADGMLRGWQGSRVL